MNPRKKLRIVFNAPVTLTFALICLAVQLISMLTGGASNRLLFSVYRTSWANPLAYLRCFTHVLGHSGWDHLLGNMMYLLILGPMLEEKYGSDSILAVIIVSALVTGLFNLLFFPNLMLMGASGVVFAMILLASFTATDGESIPVSFVLVAVLYLGQQIYQGLFVSDNVSQFTHIVGGLVGSVAGFVLSRKMNRQHRHY